MGSPARAIASVVWIAALTFSGFGAGCAAAHRPDAAVAKALAAAERQRVAAILLASADDELPVALPVAGEVAADAGPGPAPAPLAAVPGNGAADRYFTATPDDGPRSFTFSHQPNPSFEDPTRDAGGRRGERKGGRPNVRVQLFRFTVLGRPVGLRCSIKNKHLVVGAKIVL